MTGCISMQPPWNHFFIMAQEDYTQKQRDCDRLVCHSPGRGSPGDPGHGLVARRARGHRDDAALRAVVAQGGEGHRRTEEGRIAQSQ